LFIFLLIGRYEFIIRWLFLQRREHWSLSIFWFLGSFVLADWRILFDHWIHIDLSLCWRKCWLCSRFRVNLSCCDVGLTIVMLVLNWFLWLYFCHVFDGVRSLITLPVVNLWLFFVTFFVTCSLRVHYWLSYREVLLLILSSFICKVRMFKCLSCSNSIVRIVNQQFENEILSVLWNMRN